MGFSLKDELPCGGGSLQHIPTGVLRGNYIKYDIHATTPSCVIHQLTLLFDGGEPTAAGGRFNIYCSKLHSVQIEYTKDYWQILYRNNGILHVSGQFIRENGLCYWIGDELECRHDCCLFRVHNPSLRS